VTFAEYLVARGDVPKTAGVKARRVLQVVHDFARRPVPELRILDLACGIGIYAIEAALHGATVTAIDARTERMGAGVEWAERLGLERLSFEQHDVRAFGPETWGTFDVVLVLGILYHLDQRDVFGVLRSVHEVADHLVIIDTHVALAASTTVENDGKSYDGQHYQEHAPDDPADIREGRPRASIDNPTSFWFTKGSLVRLLRDTGFTSVCEVLVPLEPAKPDDRVTLVATKGQPVSLSSYPWLDGRTEEEIGEYLAEPRSTPGTKNGAMKDFLNRVSRARSRRGLRQR
jgi:SAM-dependent methyltransferase